MKVKVIARNPDEYMRETKRDLFKVPRNYDPALHPFEAPREYIRALNSVKLERVFAKPFVCNLDGHRDGVSCLTKHPTQLSLVASGAYDGEVAYGGVRLWDLIKKKCTKSFQAHEGYVRGIVFTPNGSHFLTVGDDKTIKKWSTDAKNLGENVDVILSKTIVSGISHSRNGNKFATCGEVCQLWESTRSEPLRTFSWDIDSLHFIAFNKVESHLLATCASDRSIIFYDTREAGPIRKLVMNLRTNQLAWNPMEAFVFTCANEDYNLYTYDTRRLDVALNVHKDHTSAVTCLDYSPIGRKFVSGSYDKSIRIFETHKGYSCEVYHTKRMQRLTDIIWSLDNKYVLSSSDEMNIRIWKAQASEKLGVLRPREKISLNYAEAVKKKFANHPQIRRIARHRQVPKHIYNAQNELRATRNKAKRKEANRRAHSKPGTVPFVPERKKQIVKKKLY